jgi:tRNA (guanine37-N1)-methyltransferase
MKFTVVTLFPQLIQNFLSEGLLGQAVKRGAIEIATLNPREFTSDVHGTVDDRAFGGSDGMVMKVEPLLAAVTQLRAEGECHVAVLSPQGRPWSQKLVEQYSRLNKRVVLVCGRYAGVDQRFSAFADDEISLGDFILNGGEVAACAVIESVARLQPGVLGNSVSVERDSFSGDGLLESPQFTRPREIAGMKVPSPLLSGHHEKIREFEKAVSLVRTALVRPDLLHVKPALSREIAMLEALEDAELRALGMKREKLQELRVR